MVAGSGNGLLTGGPVPIGDVICFEVAYDDLVRSSVSAGAAAARRADQQRDLRPHGRDLPAAGDEPVASGRDGRTVLQVATTGVSAIIAPNGSITAQSAASASFAWRTGRDGSDASVVTWSAPMDRSPSTAPVIRTILYGLIASMTALAATDSSPVGERDGRGTDEERRERRARSVRPGGDADEPVLDDPIPDVVLAQRTADLGDLTHLEAAVFGDDERRRPGELALQRLDRLALGLGRHGDLPESCVRPARGGGAARSATTRPDRFAPATVLRLQGALTGRWGPASACSPSSPAAMAVGPVRRIESRPSASGPEPG